MSAVVQAIAGAVIIAVGLLPGMGWMIPIGASMLTGAGASLLGGGGGQERQAQVTTLTMGEQPREALFGTTASGGALAEK